MLQIFEEREQQILEWNINLDKEWYAEELINDCKQLGSRSHIQFNTTLLGLRLPLCVLIIAAIRLPSHQLFTTHSHHCCGTTIPNQSTNHIQHNWLQSQLLPNPTSLQILWYHSNPRPWIPIIQRWHIQAPFYQSLQSHHGYCIPLHTPTITKGQEHVTNQVSDSYHSDDLMTVVTAVLWKKNNNYRYNISKCKIYIFFSFFLPFSVTKVVLSSTHSNSMLILCMRIDVSEKYLLYSTWSWWIRSGRLHHHF